jgi:TfoX/Sxy family transcriptional regulator of competence genes
MLEELLIELEGILEKKFPSIYTSLNEGATSEELRHLSDVCFNGEKLPTELDILFKWRNGQRDFHNLHQEDNRKLLSTTEIIGAWRFLNDPKEDILQPISRTWIPVFYNGAGDYLVYETQGENKWRLISYWHDDPDRDVVYLSFEDWVEDALRAANQATPEANKPKIDSYDKVDLYMNKMPKQGLKALKAIKEYFTFSIGICELNRKLKNGPVLLRSGECFVKVESELKRAKSKFGCNYFYVQKSDDPTVKVSEFE